MPDPIKDLYAALNNEGLLSGSAADAAQFEVNMADPGKRKQLYEFISKERPQMVDMDFTTFESVYSAAPKKKDGTELPGTGSQVSGSIQTSATAPIAESVSAPEISGNAPNSLLREFSGPGGPQPAATGRLEIPKQLTSTDNPIEVGALIRRQTEADSDFKEERAAQTTSRRGKRDLENISIYAQEVAKQSSAASKAMENRLGKDWQKEMANYMAAVNSQPTNAAEVEYLNEANQFLSDIKSDPNFQTWKESQAALQKAQGEFQNYAKNNPGYATDIAKTNINKMMADSNTNLAIGNWGIKKSAQILGGIASLPRTLLGTVAAGANEVGTFGTSGADIKKSDVYKWAQDMGDWADQTIEKAAMVAPTGSGTDRPLWEKMAEFEGKEVVVDEMGYPTKAFVDNKEVPINADFNERFIASGAGQKVESKFTGMKNSAFKLADVVTDLYLMRGLGGGNMAGTTAVAFGLSHQDAYNTAVNELKLTGDDASAYAMISSGLSAVIESTIGNIETKPLKLAAAKSLGLKEAKALIGKASIYDVAKAAWRPYLEAVAGENVEELVDNMAQALNNQMFNAATGSSMDTNISPEQTAETIIMTTLATTIAGGGDAMKSGSGQMYDNALNAAVQNPDSFFKVLSELEASGVVTPEQAQSQVDRISKLAQINANLPANMSDEKRRETIGLEDRRIAMASAVAASPAQEKAIEKTVKEIDNKIVSNLTKDEGEVAAQQPVTDENQPELVLEPATNEAEAVVEPATYPTDVVAMEQLPGDNEAEIELAPESQIDQELVGVFNGQFSDNPFETLPTEDRLQSERLVTADERVEAGVPDISAVVVARNTPVSEVIAAYEGPIAQEALVDDAVNLALNSMMPAQRNKVLGNQGLLATLQRNITGLIQNQAWVSENGTNPFLPQIEAVAQDFAETNLKADREMNLRDRFEPVTVEDYIAAAFAEGVKIRPANVKGQIAESKDGGTRLKYTSRNGTPIDLLAQDILQSMGGNEEGMVGMEEQDVISAIYQFINDNPKGPGDYMRDTIARRTQEQQVGTDEEVEVVDMQDAVDTVAELNEAEEAELEAFMDSYADYNDLLEDWENWDPFEPGERNDAINNLSPKIFSFIDGKINDIKSDSETGEVLQEGQGEVPQSPTSGAEQGEVSETDAGFREEVARVQTDELGPQDGTPILPIPQVEMTETGGVVTNAAAFADLLAEAGAVYDSATGGWTFTAEQTDAVNVALSSRRTDAQPVFDQVAEVANDSGVGGMVTTLLTSPGAVLFRYQAKRKLAAAKNLDDRLAVARNIHQLSRDRDERTIRRTLKRLQAAFPNIDIVTDQTMIERAKAAMGVSGPVMGFSYEGKVYVDMRYARPDTPIHEFGHIWEVWLKENNPAMHKRGVELVKESDVLVAVQKNPAYAKLPEDYQISEGMAIAIGESGVLMGDSNLVVRFQRFLSDMWSAVGQAFGFQPRFATLREFADYQASTLLSGNAVMTETSRRIKQLEGQGDIYGAEAIKNNRAIALAMEQQGIDADKIFYATGWNRGSDGFWRWGIDSSTFSMKVDPESDFDAETATVADIIDWPGLFQAYPEAAAIPVSVLTGDIMSPSIIASVQEQIILMNQMAPATIPSAVADQFWADRRLDGRDTEPGLADLAPEENVVFEGGEKPPAKFQVGNGAADYAARAATARDIIAAEIQSSGIRDIDAKSAKIADAMNLDVEHVKRIWESELSKASVGKVILTKADLNGSMPTAKEKFIAKTNLRVGRAKSWLQGKFRVGGLLPRGIFNLDQKRLGRIGSRIKDGQYIMADLELAMEKEYKNPTVAQWQHVDNVLRGEGDWSTLPESVRGPARQMRMFMDSLSRDLVRSGVMKGELIITVLENSGIEAAQEKLENWNGVNVYQALGKLPFERTDAENVAIDDFLTNQNRTVGNYLYRSYRKYDDTNWIDTVKIENPRVWTEAKQFLQDQFSKYISDIQQQRTDKIAVLDAKIAEIEGQIEDLQEGLNEDIDAAKDRIAGIEQKQSAFIQDRGRRSIKLDESFASAVKALRVLEKRAAESERVAVEDAEALLALQEPEFQRLSVVAKQIVKKRRSIMGLRDRIEAAKNYKQDLVEQYLQNSQNVEGLMYEILDIEDTPSAQLSRSKLGGKDMKILRARKDIAEPIRELMGEYKDPRINFAKSMYRAVNLLENQKFLTDLREQYAGTFFIPPNEVREGFLPISSEGSQTMSPLNGWKTTKEIRDALNSYYSPTSRSNDLVGQAFETYMKTVAAIKYGKTILSPVTHVRNFVGNVFFVINNAYDPFSNKNLISFRDAWTSLTDSEPKSLMQRIIYSISKNILKNPSGAESRAYVSRLTELRVLANGSYLGSIRELLNTMNADNVDQFFEDKLGQLANDLRKGIEETYGAEDDFFRIMAFETEKARYSKAWYGRPFEMLTDAEKVAIEEHAADLVVALMPTYSMIPQIAKDIQKFPLTGTFVAFPAEMFRVTWNQYRQIGRDLSDPRTRGIGMRRLIGAGVAQIGLTAGVTALGHWLAGIDWEEDKAARRFMFPWQDNGILMYTDFKPGEELRFINTSYTNPYSFLAKPVTALFLNYGKGWGQKMRESAWNIVEPFLSPELTAQTIGQLMYNKDVRTDKYIYNPGLGPFGDWKGTKDFLVWNLQPGVSKFVLDLGSAITGTPVNNRTPKQVSDVLLGMAGLQVERMNLEKAITSNFAKQRNAKTNARDVFVQKKFAYKNDPEGLQERFELATQEYNDVLKETGISADAAQILGISVIQMNAILKERNFSTAERAAIFNGNKIIPKFEGFNK